MRALAGWMAVVVLLAGGLVSCTLGDDATSSSLASEVDSLRSKLSDSQRTVIEQRAELDDLQTEFEELLALH